MTLSARLSLVLQLQLNATLELQQGVVSMAIIPSAYLDGQVSAALDALLIQIGLTVDLKLLNTFLIPTGTLISGPAGYQACLNVDIQLQPLVRTRLQGQQVVNR